MANKKYLKIEQFDIATKEALIKSYESILHTVGEDISREGLEKKKKKNTRACCQGHPVLTQGYELDAAEIIKSAHV